MVRCSSRPSLACARHMADRSGQCTSARCGRACSRPVPRRDGCGRRICELACHCGWLVVAHQVSSGLNAIPMDGKSLGGKFELRILWARCIPTGVAGCDRRCSCWCGGGGRVGGGRKVGAAGVPRRRQRFPTQTFPGMAAAPTDAAARRILKPVWAVCAITVLVALAIVVAAPWLVDALLNEEYENSVVLLQALAIGAIPVLFTQPLATFLQAGGSERPVAIATMVAVGSLLAATAILAVPTGAIAAPVCSGLAQCALLIALILIPQRGERRQCPREVVDRKP